ncbi:MAG: DUF1648 domain-containing protein [Georgenia sp.]
MSTADPRPPLPHRGRAWLFGVAVPLAVHLGAGLLVRSWLPRLPDEVALHWGIDGVDRVGPVSELLITTAALGGLGFVVLAVLAVSVGRTALTRRMVLALATGTAVFFAGLLLTQAWTQLDLADPWQAPSPDLPLIVVTVLAVGAGALAGALAGRDPELPADAPLPADAARSDLGAQERAVWTQQVAAGSRRHRWGWLGLALYVTGALALSILTQMWFGAVIMLALVPLMLTMLVWDVRVDAAGLTVRGRLGWPRQYVPAAEILRADVAEISPFRQFGGWGLRTSVDGRTGVVVRKGEAIAVERTGGRRLVVTVDDAATGAALLNTFAERARATTAAA